MPISFDLRGRIPVSMDQIIQPWVPITSFPVPRVITPVEVLPVAFVRVGLPSQFGFDDSFRQKALNGIGFHLSDGDGDNVPTGIYTETGRLTSELRVENPEDADQFVIVQRIERIQFDAPGGGKVEFRLKNPD